MRRESIPPQDDVMVACPKLWHLVPFDYCRRENGILPCSKAIDCWYEYFLVEDYFHRVLSPEEWEQAFARPEKSRLSQILENVNEANSWT